MKKYYFLFLAVFQIFVANAQIIQFPDSRFKAKLLASTYNDNQAYYFIAADDNQMDMVVDANHDGEIDVLEAQAVYFLNVQGYSNGLENPNNITDLTGIEYFTNLRALNCADNALTALDVSALTNMTNFRCDRNDISDLNISGLTNIRNFWYGGNQLPNVDASLNTQIVELGCDSNQITNLDVSAFPYLSFLVCNYNLITSLDLQYVNNLKSLFCDNNLLTELDLSKMQNFSSLHANNNPLEMLNMKFGKLLSYQDLTNDNSNLTDCPNLKYVCVDDYNITSFQNKLNSYNYTNCNLNTYCSFVPGGIYYTLQGQAKFDIHDNGCDSGDSIFSSLKFSITTEASSESFIGNITGNYQVPLQNGNYVIVPKLENPEYFGISPVSVNIRLPVDQNQLSQNFCITPKSPHQDLEVIIIPVTLAQPGFDAVYKIVYKNKGNTTISGEINFDFMSDLMDFVSASPTGNVLSSDVIQFDYEQLQPFEMREIFITFNLNSPMETPSVVAGTVLAFSASIYPTANDEYVWDNYFKLQQSAVNSLDPNDKTCLEGSTVTPEMIGKDVHYLIRFENNGTANARNVVVKDIIDMEKFDLESLIPLESSHPFITKKSGTNVLEFIFENINLPFDNANNDGYVVFKIKTKPNLTVGDTFSNSADIYFDYNFPIVTNTATTTVTALAIKDFDFADFFTLHPNPAGNVLNIEARKQTTISSVSIYNTLGQLVSVHTNLSQSKTIDVSNLKSGSYFLKVNSDKGTSTAKFFKK